ncbi:substrate-binding domain-containing protein [Cryobacterium sp. LW097]|uniref:substrate-binding domain-containing protein n=1 Tax=Cryobacterium sp. LW097 TaxID=1978566 RepID=UPI003513ACD0
MLAPDRHPAFSLGTSIAVAALLLSGCAANESGDETSTLAGTLDGAGSSAPGSAAIDLPVYVSPSVLVYNVDGVDTLRLDPSAIANIFSGAITRWNDPALVDLNSDATLPAEQISAVHRSDDSGTTK